jgi:hypothetical protein
VARPAADNADLLGPGRPLQTAGGQATAEGAGVVIWIPMLLFEISTGLWLLVKGAQAPEVERIEQRVAL